MDLGGLIELILVGLMLFMMSEALIGRLGDPLETGDGPAWLRQMWLPVDGLILYLAARRWRGILRLGGVAELTLAIVAWCFISALWSLDPEVTLRRSIGLLAGTLLGLYIAERFAAAHFIRLVAVIAVALALGSYAAGLFWPAFGIQPDAHGAWRGLWFEKNAMGGFMVKGVAACACAALLQPKARWPWIVGAAICTGLVILSASSTALFALAGVASLLAALYGLRSAKDWKLVAIAFLIIGGALTTVLFINQPAFLFDLVGKDATLTGRTRVWASVFAQFLKEPLYGYGYGAFWVEGSAPARTVRADLNWAAHHADNGWLDTLVQTGLIGAALVAAAVAVNTRQLLRNLRKGPEIYWLAASLLAFLITSITESTLARHHDAGWVIFVAAFAQIARLQSSTTTALAMSPPRRPPSRYQPGARRAKPQTYRPEEPRPQPARQEAGAARAKTGTAGSADALARGWTSLAALEPVARKVREAVADNRLSDAAALLEPLEPSQRSFVLLAGLGAGATIYAHPVIRAAAIVRTIERLQADLASGALRSRGSSTAEDRARKNALGALSRAIFERALWVSGLSPAAPAADAVEDAERRLSIVSPNLARIYARRLEEQNVPPQDKSEKAWRAVAPLLERTPIKALLAGFAARGARGQALIEDASPQPVLFSGDDPSSTGRRSRRRRTSERQS